LCMLCHHSINLFYTPTLNSYIYTLSLHDALPIFREMTKSIRNKFDTNTYDSLKKEIRNLKPPMRQQVIRAFSIYFHLINIAEQKDRKSTRLNSSHVSISYAVFCLKKKKKKKHIHK